MQIALATGRYYLASFCSCYMLCLLLIKYSAIISWGPLNSGCAVIYVELILPRSLPKGCACQFLAAAYERGEFSVVIQLSMTDYTMQIARSSSATVNSGKHDITM